MSYSHMSSLSAPYMKNNFLNTLTVIYLNAGSLAATPHGAERIRKSQLSPDSPEKSKLLIQLAKKQRILTLIEDAYPNAVSLRDLVK